MKRLKWIVTILISLIIIAFIIFHIRTQPQISYNEATATAQKQLRRVIGPRDYAAYNKNWVIQTHLQWYNNGHLIGTKKIYVVQINLTPNSNDGVAPKNFEFLIDARSGETLSVLQYNDMYKTPF